MRIKRSGGLLAAAAAVTGLLLSTVLVGQASATTGVCSEPPTVDIDQSLTHTEITISLACEEEAEFHRVVTASVAGAEILRVDTSTVVAASAAHATTIRIPSAEVCVEDPATGQRDCVPPLL